MVPILGFTSVQLGERILHGRWLALRRADFALAQRQGAGAHLLRRLDGRRHRARRHRRRRRRRDHLGHPGGAARAQGAGERRHRRRHRDRAPSLRRPASALQVVRAHEVRDGSRATAPSRRRCRRARSPSISAAGSACCRCCSACSATGGARSASSGIARRSIAASTPRATSATSRIVEGDARARRAAAVRRHHARRHAALLGRRRAAGAVGALPRRAAPRRAAARARRRSRASRRRPLHPRVEARRHAPRLEPRPAGALPRPSPRCAPTSKRSASSSASTRSPRARTPATCSSSATRLDSASGLGFEMDAAAQGAGQAAAVLLEGGRQLGIGAVDRAHRRSIGSRTSR